MVKVLVHLVVRNERIQSCTSVVVDIGAEIRIHIVGVHKGRAVVTGKTLAELICCNDCLRTGYFQGRLTAHRFQPVTGLIVIGSCRIGPCLAVHMLNSRIMTGKAGNLFTTVLTVTCLVVAISRTIAGRLGSAYTVDHGRNIIVTANAPLLLAGL